MEPVFITDPEENQAVANRLNDPEDSMQQESLSFLLKDEENDNKQIVINIVLAYDLEDKLAPQYLGFSVGSDEQFIGSNKRYNADGDNQNTRARDDFNRLTVSGQAFLSDLSDIFIDKSKQVNEPSGVQPVAPVEAALQAANAPLPEVVPEPEPIPEAPEEAVAPAESPVQSEVQNEISPVTVEQFVAHSESIYQQ